MRWKSNETSIRIKFGILFGFHRHGQHWKKNTGGGEVDKGSERAGSLADVISNLLTGHGYEWIRGPRGESAREKALVGYCHSSFSRL